MLFICHQFKLDLGFRDNCTLQGEHDSFIVNWTLFLGKPTSHSDWSDEPITHKLLRAV